MQVIGLYRTVKRIQWKNTSRLRRVCSAGVIVLFAASTMSAQNFTAPALSEVLSNLDVNLVGSGARAEGLGGAFIGVADDATSVLWNPAGLATLERPEASIVTRIYSQKAVYTDPNYPTSNNTQNVSQFGLNFGSLAYPLRSGGGNIVLAVAYQQQINLRKAYKTSDSLDYENTGGVNTISPGIGVKLTPFLSIGMTANFWFGHFDNSGVDSYEFYTDTTYTVVQSVTTHASSNGTFSGTNFVFGLLFDFSEIKAPIPLKLGVSLKTPFNLKESFSGTTDVGGFSYSGTTTTQMPLMLGFGASYQIGDNFTIAADYEMREFKDKTNSTQTDFGQLNSVGVTESNTNLNQLRIGAEYLIVTGVGVFPIRAGFRTVPTVLANENPTFDSYGYFLPNYSGPVSGSAFSIGTGYIANRFALDAAYTSTSYTQSTSSTSNMKYTTGVLSASLIFYF